MVGYMMVLFINLGIFIGGVRVGEDVEFILGYREW